MNTIEQIKNGMTVAFFACAYADQAEECGQPLSGEIMDQLPSVIDPAALHAADTLVKGIIDKFVFVEPGLSDGGKLLRVYIYVSNKWLASEDQGDRELTPELFGHYCAMQAMGTGVGLESFGSSVRDAVRVPYVEFGSYSLERDYFEPCEDDDQ